ncbi:MAG TPA: two-component regulator propeller domain-containing protein [Chryseosolibacter sp.]
MVVSFWLLVFGRQLLVFVPGVTDRRVRLRRRRLVNTLQIAKERMMKYAVRCAWLWMIVSANLCNAQDKTEVRKANTRSATKDAIPYNGPTSITRNVIQDRNGNIWMASWEGIFQYDGKSFANITSKVSPARFFSVLEDRDGNLWFGSIGAGVYRYDGGSFRNFTTKDGLINNEVTCIYQDKAGNVWFGVNGGVSRYDGKSMPAGQASFRNYMMNGDFMAEDKTGKTVPDFTRPPNEVNSIVEDRTGRLWFATRGNTFVFDGNTFTAFTNNGEPFINVRTIIEDRKGNIWLGGNDGLWRYDGSGFTNFGQKFVGYIMEDKKGNIWTSSVSADDRGWALSRYDGKSLYKSFYLNSPVLKPGVMEVANNSMIFGIIEDDKGNIWFGADGIYRYDGNTVTDFKAKESRE